MDFKKVSMLVLMALMVLMVWADNQEILIVTGEWDPYVSEKLPNYGPLSELITEICKEAHIKVKYQFYPWPRTEKMIEDGEAFAAYPYALSAERKSKYLVSDPIFFAVNPIMYYAKNPKMKKPLIYNKPEDLKPYIVGVQSGSFIENELLKAGVKVEKTTDMENSVKKLQMGRIDFIIDEQVFLYSCVTRVYPNEVDEFKTLSKNFTEKIPNGVIISKKYPNSQELLKKFNEGLKKIKENGVYDRIVKKYKIGK